MKNIQRIIVILLIVSLGGAVLFFNEEIQRELGLIDSDALLGGEIERGYPFAGYLISYEPGGGMKTCGYTILNNRVGVTASHCVDNSSELYLGLGEFSLQEENHIEVERAIQKEQWIENKERAHDFAILNFNDQDGFFPEYAEIASPTAGCNYRVIAYGRTEDPSENFIKPRKSAVLCAGDIQRNIMIVTGQNGESGICFGDSGSPVFYEDTNKLVGVIASIILEDPNDTDPCAFGNSAIVVRADANQNLINQNIQQISQLNDSVSVVDGNSLIIDIRQETFLERIGIEGVSEQDQIRYALYAAVGAIVLIIIMLLFVVTSRSPQKPSWEG